MRNSDAESGHDIRLRPSLGALRALDPRTRSRGRGEQAALEVLNAAIVEDPSLEAVLIFADSDVRKRRIVRALPEHVTTLSTGDLLHEFEAAGRIQSSDQILDRAPAKERNVEAQRTPQADTEARARLREHPAQGGEPPTQTR